jgi:glycine C-acetyltransferase
MLGSNDYLGLAGDQDVIRGAVKALEVYGAGLAMNQPFATTPLHEELRKRIAAYTGTEAALLFGSCTAANIALLTTLAADANAVILSDANSHASIIDGCRLSKGRTSVYRTRDVTHLEEQVEASRTDGRRTIISDGVFSVEGDIAPAPDLSRVAHEANATLVLDESHAAGVIGEGGRGTAEACGLDPRRDVTAFTGTFAKAFGAGGGGYIAGPADLLAEVKRVARFYIFNTGMHVAAVGAALVGVSRAQSDVERRERLYANTRRLRASLTEAGFTLLGGVTPITPILVGDEDKARAYSARLTERGLVAPVMTFPIVPKGEARLRLMPSASHTQQDIDLACEDKIQRHSSQRESR